MPELNLGINASLDLNSIVSIGVARAERELTAKVRAKKEQLKDNTTAITTAKKNIEDLCVVNYPAEHAKAATQALNALTQLGATVAVNYATDFQNQKAQLSVVVRKNGWSETIATHEAIFPDVGVTDLFEGLLALEEENGRLQVEILDLRKRLSNMGSLERTVRAQLAEAQLRGMGADGEALIEAVVQNLDDNIKALPGF
jgi:hypothetical protein